MPTPYNILVVDDEPDMLRYLRTLLEADGYRVDTANSGAEALDRVRSGFSPDLIMLDTLMPGLDGLQTLEMLNQVKPGLRVFMLSCQTDPRTIVQAMHLGARDYIAKPFQKAELDAAINRALGLAGHESPGEVEPGVEDVSDDVKFIAGAESMRKIRAQVGMIARVDVPVLLLGESGTGKEVVARLIHKLSSRADRTFLKVNCAALPGELLESELFGYEPGAFTGALKSKPGKFEQCDQGTILLDEIGEMPPGLQAKLLHVLQDQEFSRLGSRSVVRVDVRILAATNVDIPHALTTKKLREDLYYRLNALTITLPPLRERRESIPALLRHFMMLFSARFGREPLPLSPRLMSAAVNHSWPGNLRELENFVKRYLIIGDEGQMLSDLGGEGEGKPAATPAPAPARPQSNDLKSLVRDLKSDAEMEAIGRVLEQTKWNRKEAARQLNISYKALLYKIRKYELEKSTRKASS